VELRDAHRQFSEAGVKLYAISYDDVEALKDFSETYGVQYPMLSDAKSEVIRRYGMLNTEVPPGDVPAYGVPFPGTFVTDEEGVVVGRFVHDSYKIRASPEHLIDSIRGEISIGSSAPSAEAGDGDLRIRAFFHGGRGTMRQGILRQVVVRFQPRDGLELIAEPAPEGLVGTSVEVAGPPGLVVEEPILPPTMPSGIDGQDLDLRVWKGSLDFAIPVYAQAELISECRPIENDTITIQITTRVAASDGRSRLEPKTETLTLGVFLEPVDMPKLRFHGDTGQRRSDMDSEPHFRRLVLRQFRRHPLGAIRSLINTQWKQAAARRRGA